MVRILRVMLSGALLALFPVVCRAGIGADANTDHSLDLRGRLRIGARDRRGVRFVCQLAVFVCRQYRRGRSSGGGLSGTLLGGTGPAAACALSTCSFTMTADADLTATFTSGDGPTATVTTTMSGDGAGVIRADGGPCRSGVCTVTYLQGSTVDLAADLGSSAIHRVFVGDGGPANSVRHPAPLHVHAVGRRRRDGHVRRAELGDGVSIERRPRRRWSAADVHRDRHVFRCQTTADTSRRQRRDGQRRRHCPLARTNPFAAATGGKIYALGGDTHSGHLTSIDSGVTAFIPATQTWSSRTRMSDVPHEKGGGGGRGRPALCDRRHFGMGSSTKLVEPPLLYFATASVERYDLGHQQLDEAWRRCQRPGRGARRRNHQRHRLRGGRRTAASGRVATLEAYDPATNTWTTRAPMPTPRTGLAGGVNRRNPLCRRREGLWDWQTASAVP